MTGRDAVVTFEPSIVLEAGESLRLELA